MTQDNSGRQTIEFPHIYYIRAIFLLNRNNKNANATERTRPRLTWLALMVDVTVSSTELERAKITDAVMSLKGVRVCAASLGVL